MNTLYFITTISFINISFKNSDKNLSLWLSCLQAVSFVTFSYQNMDLLELNICMHKLN